jgi:GntR family transcriptional repressor for pyruvate dehydrogenase complex
MKRAASPTKAKGSFRRLKRPQLVDEIIAQLRARLASGELRVGDKLPPESVLVAELGVGRTTLREAIRVLEHAGLVAVRHGSGTYIRSLSDDGILATRLRQARVLEVFQVRRALELEMMRMAVAYRTAPALAALRDALDQMRKSLKQLDERAFLEADMEMYRILAAATQNSIFREIYTSFSEALRLALMQVIAIPGVMQNCLANHEQLFEAIVARDVERAETIAKGHLDRVTRLIETVLGDARIGESNRAPNIENNAHITG